MTIKTHGRMMTNDTIGADQLAVSDYGTDNQALVTDGAGTIRWATVGIGGSVGSSTYVENIFAGDASKTKFQMTATAALEESLLVFVDGVAQPTSAFTLSSSGVGIGANSQLDEINVSPALATGQQLRVCHLGINTAIADGSITGAKITMGADAAGDLLYHNGTQYDRFPIGTKGQLFATNGTATAPEWILGDTAGDILFYNGTNYEKLAIGTAGQLLATNPGATAPYWLNAAMANLPAVGADGNVLTSDGTDWSSQPPLGGVGGELVSIQTFAGNGANDIAQNTSTWTRPSGVKRIEVHIVGAGGWSIGDGAGNNGLGGGAGGYCIGVYDVTNLSTATVIVGASDDAANVKNSSFSGTGITTLAAGGGANGATLGGGSAAPALGGTATGGMINFVGETGPGTQLSSGGRGHSAFGGYYGNGSEGAGSATRIYGGHGFCYIKEYSDASAHLVGEKLVSTQLFTTSGSGTWTRPAGVTKIEVWATGSGGNSPSTLVSGNIDGGGGGGGTSYAIVDVTNIATAPYVVGTVIAGNATNGASSFNTTIIGNAGANGTTSSGGLGGTGSGGTSFPGANGDPTSTPSNQNGGNAGGESHLGGIFGKGANGQATGPTNGTTGAVFIKEYSDPSLVSGGSLVPTGVLNPYAGATAPAGWLLCWGQAISRTTYSKLFTAIGTTYGVGDGSTTFLLPDMRGRVAAGQDDMGGTSANRLPNALGSGLDGDVLGAVGGSEQHGHGTTSINAQGGSGGVGSVNAATSLQPTIILNYIIKT